MPWLRKAWYCVRLLAVLVVPVGGLLLLAMAAGRVETPLSGRADLVADVVLAFGFLAGAFLVLQRAMRCPPRLPWLPLAYAGIVLLGPNAAGDAKRLLHPEGPDPPVQLTAVDVLLVQPAASKSAVTRAIQALPKASEDALGWDAQFSVASRSSKRLRLDLKGGPLGAPLDALERLRARGQSLPASLVKWTGWRPNAVHAVVLNVDDIDPLTGKPKSMGSRPEDWDELIETNLAQPVYAILGAASEERLKEWRVWAAERGGDAVRFRDAGRPVLLDAVLRIATERSEKFADALAWRHRPKLLFDTDEPFRKPLDIERVLASDTMRVCRKKLGFTRCYKLEGTRVPEEHAKRNAWLSFDPREIRALRAPGVIYYHVVHHGQNELHLDYWWYFPYNPTADDRFKAACQPGATAEGLTCFDHLSDWEGITVVLRRNGRSFDPHYVVYAQHEFGVAYEWGDLWLRWEKQGLLEDDRPVVFVAKDSHASYPTGCETDCRQIPRPRLPEGNHDGGKPWTRNHEVVCLRACLKRLPETSGGRPAGWNATPVRWGDRSCILGTICNRGVAPRAPRYQVRFWEPWKPLPPRGRKSGSGSLRSWFAKY